MFELYWCLSSEYKWLALFKPEMFLKVWPEQQVQACLDRPLISSTHTPEPCRCSFGCNLCCQQKSNLFSRRLSLKTKVELKKLRFFSIPHEGRSLCTHPVSKELLDIQKQAGRICLFVQLISTLMFSSRAELQTGFSSDVTSSCDTLQVVERLEADLGVKVQQVHLPELRYGFQIWNMYMGLPDEDGRVSPPDPPPRTLPHQPLL